MCKEPRVFTTSFRYSGEVANVIDSIDCKTFADKFEFICLDYSEKKEKKENYIKKLDAEILKKEQDLRTLNYKLLKFNEIAKNAQYLQDAILTLTNKCNT